MVTHPARSFGPSHDVSFEFPKIAPSPYSSRGVHSRFHVAVVASENGNQPLSRSASVVSHHLGGLLFLDPLRIFVGVPVLGFMTFHAALRHNPRHEVLPFEALLLVCSGLNRCRSTSPVGLTSPAGFPRQFTVRLAPSSLVFLPTALCPTLDDSPCGPHTTRESGRLRLRETLLLPLPRALPHVSSSRPRHCASEDGAVSFSTAANLRIFRPTPLDSPRFDPVLVVRTPSR